MQPPRATWCCVGCVLAEQQRLVKRQVNARPLAPNRMQIRHRAAGVGSACVGCAGFPSALRHLTSLSQAF
eukprot:788298-Prymnesium_polylepis.1